MTKIEMNTNLFHFDPFGGLVEGIPVTENLPTLKNDGSVYPPHIRCGESFIGVDRVSPPVSVRHGDALHVTRGFIRRIDPVNGGRSFDVISSHGRASVLLQVNLRTPSSFRVRDKAHLRAWEGVTQCDGVETILPLDVGCGLFLLNDQGQEVDVFVHNGFVFRLRLEKSAIVNVPLSQVDMARMRISQYESQIEEICLSSNQGVPRLHGILGSAIRLLRLSANNAEVRSYFVNFLADHLGQLIESMRREIRSILLQANDKFAGTFAEGADIISLADRQAYKLIGQKLVEAVQKRKDVERKKVERIARNQAERLVMRGDSSVGRQKRK